MTRSRLLRWIPTRSPAAPQPSPPPAAPAPAAPAAPAALPAPEPLTEEALRQQIRSRLAAADPNTLAGSRLDVIAHLFAHPDLRLVRFGPLPSPFTSAAGRALDDAAAGADRSVKSFADRTASAARRDPDRPADRADEVSVSAEDWFVFTGSTLCAVGAIRRSTLDVFAKRWIPWNDLDPMVGADPFAKTRGMVLATTVQNTLMAPTLLGLVDVVAQRTSDPVAGPAASFELRRLILVLREVLDPEDRDALDLLVGLGAFDLPST